MAIIVSLSSIMEDEIGCYGRIIKGFAFYLERIIEQNDKMIELMTERQQAHEPCEMIFKAESGDKMKCKKCGELY